MLLQSIYPGENLVDVARESALSLERQGFEVRVKDGFGNEVAVST